MNLTERHRKVVVLAVIKTACQRLRSEVNYVASTMNDHLGETYIASSRFHAMSKSLLDGMLIFKWTKLRFEYLTIPGEFHRVVIKLQKARETILSIQATLDKIPQPNRVTKFLKRSFTKPRAVAVEKGFKKDFPQLLDLFNQVAELCRHGEDQIDRILSNH